MVLLEGSKVVGSNMGLVSRGPVFSTGSVAPCLASGLGFSGGLGFWGPRGPSCRLGVFKGSLVDLSCMLPRVLRVKGPYGVCHSLLGFVTGVKVL